MDKFFKQSIVRDVIKEHEVLIEHSPLGVILTDINGRFIYVNPSFREMLGYTKEEIRNKQIADVVYPNSVNNNLDEVRKKFVDKGVEKLEKEYIHKDGYIVETITRIAAVYDEKERSLYQCMVIEDVTDIKCYNRELNYQSSHDDITHLINRREFERCATLLISGCIERKQEYALLFLSLDRFKVVNANCGYVGGDEFLQQISRALKAILNESDIFARLGGDEFAILVENCSNNYAYNLAKRIREIVQKFRFSWGKKIIGTSVSIGMVYINENASDFSILLSNADAACSFAKSSGRNSIYTYHPDDLGLVRRYREMEWVIRINEALDKERLCFYVQDIVSIENPIEKNYELLIRLIDEKGGVICPDTFLPAAVRYDLMSRIDSWVLARVFQKMEQYPDFFSEINLLSINLSSQSVAEPEFLDYTIAKINEFNINTQKLCFELTETAAIKNLSTAVRFISTLRDLGCCFALDDFGSGYSSFAYLKGLPVDYLKIDGLLVKTIRDSSLDKTIVRFINEIGQYMDMKIIAEFVEDNETKEILEEIGINYMQGYVFGRPVSLEHLIEARTQK